jgi:hypothetical protein
MLDFGKALYTNHLGHTFEFGAETGAFLGNLAELFSYERVFEDSASAYQTIAVKPRAIPVTVSFNGDVPKSRSKFFEVIDLDAEAGQPGTLRVGDYKMEGIFVASASSSFEYGYGEMYREMTFLSDNPIWRRDVVKIFEADQTRAAIINESYRSSPVTIEVFGSAQTNTASVTIGGTIYEVNQSVPEGSTLVIDGLEKTAMLYDSEGNATNVLDKRVGEQVKGSGYYLFEEVPSGHNVITSRTHGRIRVTLHEQRLEVKFK